MAKNRGHYCKICGEYKANEKFSGKGHAAHICKECAKLPPAKRAEAMTLQKLYNLPWHLSKEQRNWLNNRRHDKRPEVQALAREIYDMRFGRPTVSEESMFVTNSDLDEIDLAELFEDDDDF